jgi:hypothetical protein
MAVTNRAMIQSRSVFKSEELSSGVQLEFKTRDMIVEKVNGRWREAGLTWIFSLAIEFYDTGYQLGKVPPE